MAVIHLDHVPETTKVNQPLVVILPDPGRMENQPVRDRKVLYLLHGLSDDATAWQRFSTIENVATKYGLVVVIPSFGRSFYTDQPNGQRYFTYLIEELPQYLSDLFHLAPRREDTLIAGISMGGYGVMKAALHYPQRFYAAASFSGFLSLQFLAAHPDDPRQHEFETIFGDLHQMVGSRHDPAVWVKNAAAAAADLPQLYVSCGRQDDLYPLNQLFLQDCARAGIAVNFHEEDAGHVWSFWDKQIRWFLSSVLDQS